MYINIVEHIVEIKNDIVEPCFVVWIKKSISKILKYSDRLFKIKLYMQTHGIVWLVKV